MTNLSVVLAADSSRDMTASSFAGAAPGQPQDYGKMFKAEIEHLELAQGQYSWIADGVEDRVLKRYERL